MGKRTVRGDDLGGRVLELTVAVAVVVVVAVARSIQRPRQGLLKKRDRRVRRSGRVERDFPAYVCLIRQMKLDGRSEEGGGSKRGVKVQHDALTRLESCDISILALKTDQRCQHLVDRLPVDFPDPREPSLPRRRLLPHGSASAK